ncbi:MAG: hypothetical protein PF541_05620 [Prolixibacteraceae bacterium]|jgi:hypothetical protein|nr:hypothetical protein [Prolixibacteraceae bacterium]
MKKILLIILLSTALFSCRTTFDQTLLRPTEGTINPLLPRLGIQEYTDEIKYAYGNQITSNSKMFTLFERELENICHQRGDIKGQIEPIISINEANVNYGLYYLSILTGFLPNFVGMPFYSSTYQLEVEFRITDLNGDKIWKKLYYDKKKIYYGLYYNWDKRGDEMIMKIYRQMITNFKKDLQKDVNQIASDLS